MKKINVAFVVVLLFAVACQSKKVPNDAKIVELDSKKVVVGNRFQLANFTLQLDEKWEEEDASNSMRVTQFKLKEHPEQKIVVSYFGDMDNKVEENIDRWKNQFSDLKSFSELDLLFEDITALKILGTFKKKPFPMAQNFVDTPNYGTLAAIIPSNEGPYFLKLTATKEIIEEQEDAFIGVLNSYEKR